MEKVLAGKSLSEAFPTVKKVVLMEGDLPEDPDLAANVLTWDELLNLGRSTSDQLLDERERDQAVNQAAMMLYTSGTTGPPKGTFSIATYRYSVSLWIPPVLLYVVHYEM